MNAEFVNFGRTLDASSLLVQLRRSPQKIGFWGRLLDYQSLVFLRHGCDYVRGGAFASRATLQHLLFSRAKKFDVPSFTAATTLPVESLVYMLSIPWWAPNRPLLTKGHADIVYSILSGLNNAPTRLVPRIEGTAISRQPRAFQVNPALISTHFDYETTPIPLHDSLGYIFADLSKEEHQRKRGHGWTTAKGEKVVEEGAYKSRTPTLRPIPGRDELLLALNFQFYEEVRDLRARGKLNVSFEEADEAFLMQGREYSKTIDGADVEAHQELRR